MIDLLTKRLYKGRDLALVRTVNCQISTVDFLVKFLTQLCDEFASIKFHICLEFLFQENRILFNVLYPRDVVEMNCAPEHVTFRNQTLDSQLKISN